ncbi:MAG: hypothetical protein AUI33_13210 [Ignavibacteria bacterium 13_1_40CM_2_61_4]|nr:MAG: hypothetical protein AUI33_13210 [Ignavibacteria bacterium 13_1_40CM_2_61_4]
MADHGFDQYGEQKLIAPCAYNDLKGMEKHGDYQRAQAAGVKHDVEGKTIELNPNQGVTISKGVMHRPRAPRKTVMLMAETSAIQPTGD